MKGNFSQIKRNRFKKNKEESGREREGAILDGVERQDLSK